MRSLGVTCYYTRLCYYPSRLIWLVHRRSSPRGLPPAQQIASPNLMDNLLASFHFYEARQFCSCDGKLDELFQGVGGLTLKPRIRTRKIKNLVCFLSGQELFSKSAHLLCHLSWARAKFGGSQVKSQFCFYPFI